MREGRKADKFKKLSCSLNLLIKLSKPIVNKFWKLKATNEITALGGMVNYLLPLTDSVTTAGGAVAEAVVATHTK